jgi:DNA-binding SARP family transcriptional activator/WD40 repeat protein
MTIAVLGPLSIDGDATTLGRRDRVVLEVLSIGVGGVVSADRLADALWGEQLPPSWSKVVQGCVMRLRRVLGASAIETSTAGYRLVVTPDDIDAHHFERLVRRSRELLILGEHERTAYLSGEALALWRGPALAELDGWPDGRVEAARLDELRLDAEEIQIDAALRAGHYREVLAEAQTRVGATPLRERRWALLALAQYQAGRQGDALRTLTEARRTLVTELGVEPGPDLIALEQAILRQDPSLVAATVLPPAKATCPYLGLVPYDVDDADAFFGRDSDVESCLQRLSAVGILAVIGPSGSGKSSLVRAGVAAKLQVAGRRVVVLNPGAHPMDALTALPSSGPMPVLVVDQCEEVVTLCEDPAEQARFFDALAAHAERGPLVVAVRADRLGDISANTGFARLVEPGVYLLSAMDESDLRAAIEGPARQAGLLLEPGLVDLLVREVEGEPGALPLLSHALHQTWQRREGRTLTVDGYRTTGGIRGSVAQSAEELYELVPADQRPVLRDMLLRLVAPTPEGEPVRSRVPRRLVATDEEHDRLIELLVRARLVTSDEGVVELAHEALVRAWPRLRGWLDDDVEGQRILRHLTMTADSWDALHQPDSELYRGVRLAQAVEWQQRVQPDLAPQERAFLDASVEAEQAEVRAAEARQRTQARQNRRLRALLVTTAAVLAVALVAGAIAFVQSRRAAEQRDRATAAARRSELQALETQAERDRATAAARRSALQALETQAQSVGDTQRDLAALLAIEAYRLDPGSASRAALFSTFTGDPGFEGYARVSGIPRDGATSIVVTPDSHLALVTGHSTAVHAVDLDSRVETGKPFPDPGFPKPGESRLALSGDGTLLAQIVGGRFDSDTSNDWLVLYDVGSRSFRVPPIPLTANVGDVAISPDGQWVVVAGGARSDAFVYRADTGVLVGTIPGLPRPPDCQLRFNTAAVVFDGTGHLYVASDAGPVRVFDPVTLEELARLPAPPAYNGPGNCGGTPSHLAVSRNGQTLVGNSEYGTLAVWDLPARELRWSRGDTDCQSIAIAPAAETSVYCGDQAGSVLAYDLTSGEPAGRRFPTQQGLVFAMAVTPDESRLVFSSVEKPLLGVRRVDGGGPIQRNIAPGTNPTAYSSDGRRLLVHEVAGGVSLWDPATGTMVDPLDDLVDATSFIGPDRLASGFPDGSTGVYDFHTHRQVMRIEPRQSPPRGAALDPAHGRALVWYEDGEHFFVDATGKRTGPEMPVKPFTNRGAFTADGRFVALANQNEGLSLYDTTTGARVAGPIYDAIRGVAIGNDDLLVASSRQGELLFLDARTLKAKGPSMPAGPGAVAAEIEFSAHGSLLRASGPRETLLVDVAARTVLGDPIASAGPTAPGGQWALGLAALRPDGKELAVANATGTTLWDLDPEHWVKAACQVASRDLTRDEWTRYIGDLAPYRKTCPGPA